MSEKAEIKQIRKIQIFLGVVGDSLAFLWACLLKMGYASVSWLTIIWVLLMVPGNFILARNLNEWKKSKKVKAEK